jgi:hypothetical protein
MLLLVGTSGYYWYLLRIFYGFFTRGEHNGPGHFIVYISISVVQFK